MINRIKKLFRRKPKYPVAVYVRGRLVHAGNATITSSMTEPFTVVFEDELKALEGSSKNARSKTTNHQ